MCKFIKLHWWKNNSCSWIGLNLANLLKNRDKACLCAWKQKSKGYVAQRIPSILNSICPIKNECMSEDIERVKWKDLVFEQLPNIHWIVLPQPDMWSLQLKIEIATGGCSLYSARKFSRDVHIIVAPFPNQVDLKVFTSFSRAQLLHFYVVSKFSQRISPKELEKEHSFYKKQGLTSFFSNVVQIISLPTKPASFFICQMVRLNSMVRGIFAVEILYWSSPLPHCLNFKNQIKKTIVSYIPASIVICPPPTEKEKLTGVG